MDNLNQKIIISFMSLNDLEIIKDILNSDFDDFWNYNILKDELQSKNSKYIIAKSNNEIIGFAGIKVILDEANIMNIVTKKSYRNKGIGALLLNNLIDLCKNLGLISISLEVNESNLIAIHLYENSGFRKIGSRKHYYENNTAILMKKTLD